MFDVRVRVIALAHVDVRVPVRVIALAHAHVDV